MRDSAWSINSILAPTWPLLRQVETQRQTGAVSLGKLCWHCCDQWADFGQLFLERREEINKTTPCFSQIVALIKQEFLCAFAVYANSALH